MKDYKLLYSSNFIKNNKLIMKSLISSSTLFFMLILFGCSSPNNPENPEIDLNINYTHKPITNDLEYPWQLAFTPDNRIFITEVKGLVRIVEKDELLDEPWFDLNKYMETENLIYPRGAIQRSGLQGIAVDPNFQHNGYVYIGFAYNTENYSYDFNRLLRLRENPETKKGELDAVLLDSVPGFDLHQAAQLKFGPDDKLYWSVGDRFNVASAQDLDDLSGKILRLNNDGTVPEDNPFPKSLIFSYGHRNAQGFDWHPESNTMFATEHGPSSGQGCCHDEINIIEPGNNYGWPTIRGDETAEGMITPFMNSGVAPDGEPAPDYTWAPSGALFVKTGPWKGLFMFASLRQQSIMQLELNDNYEAEADSLVKLLDHEYGRIRSLDQATDGSIYVITSNSDRTQLGPDYLIKLDVFYEELE
jgi:glucose/arabinose dehydrogenase